MYKVKIYPEEFKKQAACLVLDGVLLLLPTSRISPDAFPQSGEVKSIGKESKPASMSFRLARNPGTPGTHSA